MKRWSDNGEIESPKIDAFLAEIWEVCERHGMAISYDDINGSFEIVPIGVTYRDRLMSAEDRTAKARR